jgi:hypothetical protein
VVTDAGEDPRLSDGATGLPPLEQVDPGDTMLMLAWHASQGIATSPATGATVAVRYLSVRGLMRVDPADPDAAEWAQVHIAVPVEHAVDVAAALAMGTTEL